MEATYCQSAIRRTRRGSLTQREVRSVLEVIRNLGGVHDPDAFRAGVVAALPGVVPCDICTYNDIDLAAPSIVWTANAPERLFPGALATFGRHLAENPFIPYRRRTGDGGAVRLSDLVSRRRFAGTGLYAEFYRPLRLEHSMAAALRLDRRQLVALGLFRGAPDFSERERACLETLRSHLGAAYRNVELVAGLAEEIRLLTRGMDELRRGLVAIDARGRIRTATHLAREWLEAYFPGGTPKDVLPEPVGRWTRRFEVEAGRLAPEPLVVARAGARLLVRLVRAPTGRLLLLDEQRERIDPRALRTLGLAHREAEILALVAAGLTNPAVAMRLGCSPRTVQTHLERVYRKLGVSTRAAAVARACGLAAGPGS